MLDGKVGELELGAILMAYRIKGESLDELRGFYRALQERVTPIVLEPVSRRPVVFGSYNGARKQAKLLPLLALLLESHGVPVLIHGVRNDASRITTAAILAALNIPVSESATRAALRIGAARVAFLTADVCHHPSPGYSPHGTASGYAPARARWQSLQIRSAAIRYGS